MSTIAESVGPQNTQLAAALRAGVQSISGGQTVTFRRYVRVVLPLDGFVFWVRPGLLSPGALINAEALNMGEINAPPMAISAEADLVVAGSLHIGTTTNQDADENYAINRVVFTSTQPVQDLNEIGPNVIYLATAEGRQFSFSQRRSYYKQADLHHYVGDAVYPALETQIVDNVSQLDVRSVVVSNSLPIWLALTKFAPVWPSYLLPDNQPPPYISVHIEPSGTRALQSVPRIDEAGSHWQLAQERVRFSLFGLRNNAALDYQDYLFQYSLDTDAFGLMNCPVMRDEKRQQNELSAIAQKKTFEMDVSYYQARVQTVARQLILSAIPTFIVA